MQNRRARRDSNPQPSDPKSDALSIELRTLVKESYQCVEIGFLGSNFVERVDGVVDVETAESSEAGIASHLFGSARGEAERAESGAIWS